ncbi:uncharacterized protein LOC107514902 isoform X2 [Rousettus aegyptiacus]|uniref:uncharacterized protein LOC107514902 isoform X2 n=1 Tax=Rousettus aegyptiacus TaxID=9407 RepID=UPI00168D4F53|nr:uncharacterized protein LOC107514902 isoform X2 [Rousettus aegyptiacus]
MAAVTEGDPTTLAPQPGADAQRTRSKRKLLLLASLASRYSRTLGHCHQFKSTLKKMQGPTEFLAGESWSPGQQHPHTCRRGRPLRPVLSDPIMLHPSEHLTPSTRCARPVPSTPRPAAGYDCPSCPELSRVLEMRTPWGLGFGLGAAPGSWEHVGIMGLLAVAG